MFNKEIEVSISFQHLSSGGNLVATSFQCFTKGERRVSISFQRLTNRGNQTQVSFQRLTNRGNFIQTSFHHFTIERSEHHFFISACDNCRECGLVFTFWFNNDRGDNWNTVYNGSPAKVCVCNN